MIVLTAVVVLQGSTVGDLIKSIQSDITRQHVREGRTTTISWSVLIPLLTTIIMI